MQRKARCCNLQSSQEDQPPPPSPHVVYLYICIMTFNCAMFRAVPVFERAATYLECLRQVPVEQSDMGLYASCEERVNHVVVEVHAYLVDLQRVPGFNKSAASQASSATCFYG